VQAYLAPSKNINWDDPDVWSLAMALGAAEGAAAVAKRCFEWVRDEVRHSADHGDQVVTCTASEVLRERTGLCYAKSHLLAALLRANGIPAGLGYQRLSVDDVGSQFCLHGFAVVSLPGVGWYRADARGNRPGLTTEFDPPREALAFETRIFGERTFTDVWPEPLPVVVDALRRTAKLQEALNQLPDWDGAQ